MAGVLRIEVRQLRRKRSEAVIFSRREVPNEKHDMLEAVSVALAVKATKVFTKKVLVRYRDLTADQSAMVDD